MDGNSPLGRSKNLPNEGIYISGIDIEIPSDPVVSSFFFLIYLTSAFILGFSLILSILDLENFRIGVYVFSWESDTNLKGLAFSSGAYMVLLKLGI